MQASKPTSATLGGVCSHAGPQLLDVVLAPRGLAAPVAGVSIHDPMQPPGAGLAAEDLVLALGTSGSDERMRDLLAAAAAATVTAIAVKLHSAAPTWVLAAAEEAGVALVSVESDVSWGELYGLLRASLAADRTDELPTIPGAAMGDLLAVADATAAIAGGPVTIEDLQGRVLAFSREGQEVDSQRAATILGRRVPDRWMRELRRHGVLERLTRSEDVIAVDISGMTPRRAIAIRAGDAVLGAIWLAGDSEHLAANADVALREGAQIAALHIARHRTFDDLERRVRGGMLRMLLQGEGLPETMLGRLGLPPDAELVVLCVAPSDDGGAVNRLLDLVVVHLQAFRWQAAATVLEGRVYVVVALHAGGELDALRRIAQDCVTRAHRALDVDLRAGIGERVSSARDIPCARRWADRCVELTSDANRVVMLDEIHGRALLADVDDFLRAHRFATAPELRKLLAHDRDNGTDYISTLAAALAAQGDAVRAAADLRVHVNTVRYRVRRIVEITGTDLSDPDDRLALELQLRARRARSTWHDPSASPARSGTPG